MHALLLLLACTRHETPPPDLGSPGGGHGPSAEGGEHAGHHGGAGHAGGAAADDDATARHRFDDVKKWTKAFDDPERDAWQKPAELVAALGIQPGWTVADIGAGTGYFNRWLAGAVGPGGRVIAVDVEPNLVAHMAERATKEGTPNVEARLGKPDDPGLRPGEADLVLLVNTYHHIDDRVAYFTRLRAALRPGGRLAVVDYKPGDLPVGPAPDHKIAPEKVDAELAEAGWSFLESVEVLPYQFVRVYGAG